MKQQSGFTLIELIMVILILAILAATALPKLFNLKDDAGQAAVSGMAGALSTANTINYGVRSLHSGSGVAVDNCTDLGSADVIQGGLSGDFSIAASAITPPATGLCTVTHTATGKTATFAATGIN